MSQYAINHAKSLLKRAYTILDHYNEKMLHGEMTHEKWLSVFMESTSIMDIKLPDSSESFWEEIDHRLLNTQIDLLTEMDVYCIKEIALTLWGLDLAALYYANPSENNLNKLLFATELICYAEAALSVTLFEDIIDLENNFVSVKKQYKKKEEKKEITEVEKKKRERKRKEREDKEKKINEMISYNHARYQSYFQNQSNAIKYRKKIPLYIEISKCFIKHPDVERFIDASTYTFKKLQEDFNVDSFVQSEEFTNLLNPKKEEKTEQQPNDPSKEDKKTEQQPSDEPKKGNRASFKKVTNTLIQLLPSCIAFAQEDNISIEDAFAREIKNGKLYYLNPRKKDDSPSKKSKK